MGAVVVHDHMHVGASGEASIHMGKELQEFRGAVTAMQLPDDLAGSDVQSRERCGGAVTPVVVGAPLCTSR